MISILHISDLHITAGADWNNMNQALLDEAKEKVHHLAQGQKFLVITGDFHNYNEADYRHAKDFLPKLIDAMGIDPSKDVFVVPGNHDVGNDRSIAPYVEDIEEWQLDQVSAVAMLRKGEEKFLKRRMKTYDPYCAFIKEMGIYGTDTKPADVHVRNWRGKLNLMHLNTTLVSDGSRESTEIVDINSATSETIWTSLFDPQIPSLSLGHNCFYDLDKKQQGQLTPVFLRKNVSAYLCGDRHQHLTDRKEEHIYLKSGYQNNLAIPNVVCMKTATDPKDTYSEFGFYWHDWDEETNMVTLAGRIWKRDEEQSEFQPLGNPGSYIMRIVQTDQPAHDKNKAKTDIDNAWNNEETQESHDVENYLLQLSSLQLKQNKMPFAYDYNKLQTLCGRDDQMQKLTSFAEGDSRRFLFWVVTGPAGIGKSKLVFYFGRNLHQKKNWLVRSLDRIALQKLCELNNWHSNKNILLIIDYANEQEHLTQLLQKLSMLIDGENEKKVRVLLIAREGINTSRYSSDEVELPQWYTEIVWDAKSVKDHLYSNEFLNLEGLSVDDCNVLHKDYVRNCLNGTVTEADAEEVSCLIEREIMDDSGLVRPLYALFAIDSYYKTRTYNSWDLASLQEQIYKRDWDRWKSAICGKRNDRKDLFIALTDLLIYSTIFGSWKSGSILPEPLSEACKTVIDVPREYSTDPTARLFMLLTGKNVMVDGEPVLLRLTPDMIGEYYVLMRFANFHNDMLKKWASLMASKLVDCKDFFVRAIQDFGSYKPFLRVFLKVFKMIAQLLQYLDEDTHKVFAFILETLFQNCNRSGDAQLSTAVFEMLKAYIKENEHHCVYAAELALLFHENKPHIGNEKRMSHFRQVEDLYAVWPNSRKIAVAYIGFLGDIAASKIGAYTPGYYDDYVEKFENLSNLVESPYIDIKKAFMPVLFKMIQRAISVQDWDRASKLENDYLRRIMEQNKDEELLLEFINGYDIVIIALAKERRIVFPRTKLELTPTEQQLRKRIDSMLENDIDYFKRIIENERKPSLNFTWTYVSKLSMIAKNLFINECDPYKESFFCYMLDEYKKIHSSCADRKSSMLKSHILHMLNVFCDTKAEAIPIEIRMKCFLTDANMDAIARE